MASSDGADDQEVRSLLLIGRADKASRPSRPDVCPHRDPGRRDRCRGWLADDETEQAATPDAFEVLQFLAAKRPGATAAEGWVDAKNVGARTASAGRVGPPLPRAGRAPGVRLPDGGSASAAIGARRNAASRRGSVTKTSSSGCAGRAEAEPRGSLGTCHAVRGGVEAARSARAVFFFSVLERRGEHARSTS